MVARSKSTSTPIKNLKVELVAYGKTKGIIQARVNDTLYEYRIRGNVEVVLQAAQRALTLGDDSEALKQLMLYRVKGSRVKVDILDTLTPPHQLKKV